MKELQESKERARAQEELLKSLQEKDAQRKQKLQELGALQNQNCDVIEDAQAALNDLEDRVEALENEEEIRSLKGFVGAPGHDPAKISRMRIHAEQQGHHGPSQPAVQEESEERASGGMYATPQVPDDLPPLTPGEPCPTCGPGVWVDDWFCHAMSCSRAPLCVGCETNMQYANGARLHRKSAHCPYEQGNSRGLDQGSRAQSPSQ